MAEKLVGKASEFKDGDRRIVFVGDTEIGVFNVDGEFYALEDNCSHEQFELSAGEQHGAEVTCALHGARFDVRSGKVLSFPAIVDIPAYPVRIEDGDVLIGLPPAE